MSVPSVVLSLLIFGLLSSSARSTPLAVRRSDTEEKMWETLYSRSLARNPWEKSEIGQDSDHLMGIKRLRRLYCNVGIGFHLQVLPDGKINGIHNENGYSLLEISPVDRGVVTLFGVQSGFFIAMNSQGKLYGSSHYNSECTFRETFLANNYNAYESAVHPAMFVALSRTGRAKRGNRATPAMTMTHFLPRL